MEVESLESKPYRPKLKYCPAFVSPTRERVGRVGRVDEMAG